MRMGFGLSFTNLKWLSHMRLPVVGILLVTRAGDPIRTRNNEYITSR